jgi:indolepyruvate ferredoxin oxidoreductase
VPQIAIAWLLSRPTVSSVIIGAREGCGDCGQASNCLSIVPLETDLGLKRAVDQTSCNKDFSCVDGFCPSFVSVIGGKLRKPQASGTNWVARADQLDKPSLALPEDRPHNLLIAGVGGSGIITVGAIVAMAAHLDHLEVAELDFTAVAQKGGSVMCHLRLGRTGMRINQPRIDWGEADGVIMGDLIVGCLPDSIGAIRHGSTRVLANTHIGSTAEFTRNPDFDSRADELLKKVRHASGGEMLGSLDAHKRVQDEFGDTTAVNMVLIGHAWQQGLIPVSKAAIFQAIALNGVAVETNRRAFAFGRVLAAGAAQAAAVVAAQPEDWRELLERRVAQLTDYQNAAYAAPYHAFVERCAAAEQRLGARADLSFTHAVANNLFKLMAYKDEYEVARLYQRPEFAAALRRQFDGDFTLRFHLAPPFIAKPGPGGAAPRKLTFGPWMMHLFALLARLKFLRGRPLDLFGYSLERKTERRLIGDYRTLVEHLLTGLSPATLDTAVRLAALPEKIRGFGHVKARSLVAVERERQQLIGQFDAIRTPLPGESKGAA